MTTSYDASARRLTVDLAQSCPPTPGQACKDPFVVPVVYGMVGADGRPVEASTTDLSPDEQSRSVIFLTEPSR